MSSKKTSTETKPGRPAGAVTKKRDVVTGLIIIDKCPKCGCEKPPKNKRLIREGKATATIKGVTVGAYKHFNAVCANDECGNVFLYREYTAVKGSSRSAR